MTAVSVFPYATSAQQGDVDTAVVTVSGETILAINSFAEAIAAVRFNADGTVDRGINNTYTQIDSLTDWIIPNSAGDSTYEIRLTVSSGNAPDTGPAVNTWHNLGVNRVWEIKDNNPTPTSQSGTWLIEIRKSGGSVLDSGSYVMTANRDDL